MAWYPDAIRREIPPGSSDPAIIPVGMVFHVRAGLGDSLYPYFNGPSGGIESHLYVRLTGVSEQYRDSSREADANYHGNSWVSGGKRYGLLSVETEGLEHGEWPPAVIAELKQIYRWGMTVHGFPARVCPAWNAGGLGYHVLFGAPGPWTPVAKSCPGPDRVKQFDAIFRPWLAAGAPLEPKELFTVSQYTEIIDRLDYLREQNKVIAGHVLNDVPRRVWEDGPTLPNPVNPDERETPLGALHIAMRYPVLVYLAANSDTLADKIAERLGGSTDAALVRQAVRDVLGSLDEVTEDGQ